MGGKTLKIILSILEWGAALFVVIALRTALDPSTYWNVFAIISIVTIVCGYIHWKLRKHREKKEKEGEFK